MTDPDTAGYAPGEVRTAQVVHETMRALQAEQGDTCPAPPWASAAADMKLSCLEGIRRAMAGVTPDRHHQAWCDFKAARGWVYGAAKDPEAKPHPTHPCLRPYEELPRHQQVKDHLFIAIVRVLAS